MPGGAGNLHDARLLAASQQRKQVGSQREVTEVVGCQMQFKAIRRDLAIEKNEGAGIVDEQVDGAACAGQAIGKASDGNLALKIKTLKADQGVGGERPNPCEGFVAVGL